VASIANLLRGSDREFFDLFERAGANIVRAAELLDEMLARYPETAYLARDILACEHDGDHITHDLIQRLNQTFSDQMVEVHRLENEGDRLTREAIASLFETGIDPMVVIRWKDIFERLENAIDSTERAAFILEGIVIKNA